jgi:hypothetical protein
MVSYAALFALAAGTIRTATVVLTTLVLIPVLVGMANSVLSDHFAYFQHVNLVERILDWLVSRGGPMRVFTGSWALIDV